MTTAFIFCMLGYLLSDVFTAYRKGDRYTLLLALLLIAFGVGAAVEATR